MSYLTINSTVFSGLPNGTGNVAAWQPTAYKPTFQKILAILPAANGTRNRVERNVVKRMWEVTWEKTNNSTMLTLRGIAPLMTTFPFVDLDGVSYTAQIEEAFEPEWAFTTPAGIMHWTIAMKFFQV